MSDPNIERLPDELLELLDREKLGYVEDASLKAAVLARVEAAVAPVGPGGGGGGGGGAAHGAGPTAAAALSYGARVVTLIAAGSFVAGGVVGGLTVSTMTSTAPTPPTKASAVVVEPAVALSNASVTAPPDAPVVELPDASESAPPTSRSARDPRGDLTRERELLDVGRAALARGNPSDALAAADRHAQRWPRGYLVEEREVVRIQALAASGRETEAQQRATQFHRTFPNSLFSASVDAAAGRSEEKSSPP